MFTLACQDAVYFLCRNVKPSVDEDLVKSVIKYKEKKKEYKEDKAKLAKLVEPPGKDKKW